MTQLFNTPEQGRRLKELLPELTSMFVWVIRIGSLDHIPYLKESNQALLRFPKEYTPALTLQELRDVMVGECDYYEGEMAERLYSYTAPELATWFIELLEERV